MFKSILAWGLLGYGLYLVFSGEAGALVGLFAVLMANNLFTDIRVDSIQTKLERLTSESNKN